MRAEPVVEVAGLVKRYAGRAVVDGVDLQADAGTVTAVLGPNGAGKTTTLEVVEGLRRPDAGWVRVLGVDPATTGPAGAALRARIGVMLQEFSGGYPGARAGEMLRHVAGLYAHPLPVDALLERLGLAEHGRTSVRRLSGGLRQRLGLAMALVGRPDLLFLDEPTAGLDPHARRAVWDLVAEVCRDGVTVLLTTHAMEEAERLADEVVILDRGRVVVRGRPADLVADGSAEVRFAGPPSLPLAALRLALPEHVTVVEAVPGRYRVSGPVDPQVVATVTAWCAGHGVLPHGLSVGQRTLEDVFLERTGRSLSA